MRRTRIVSLMTLIVAVPAATAGSFYGASVKPCFVAGRTGYELTASSSATHIVRIDNVTATASLRMQVVDDPAVADFVLVDDNDAANACQTVATIERIRVDPAATKPDLIVALLPGPADYKIYVKSANYSERDAAALFAVIWQSANKIGPLYALAKRE